MGRETDGRSAIDAAMADDDGAGFIDRALNRMRKGLFGVLFVMSKNTYPSRARVRATFIVEFMHLLAFTFSEHANYPWNKATVAWIQMVKYARLDLMNIFPSNNDIIYYIFATVMVTLTLADAFYIGWLFGKNNVQNQWPLKLLREVVGDIITLFFIPFLSVFMRVIPCENGVSSFLAMECMSAMHVAVSLWSICLSILLCAFALITASCFFNSTPTQHDYLSQSHARFDVIYLVVVSIITVLDHLVNVSDPANHLRFALMLCAGSGSLVAAMVLFQPYFHREVVVFRICLSSMWFWTNLCLLVAVIYKDDGSVAFAMFVFLGMPAAGIMSILGVEVRANLLRKMPLSAMRNPFEVELKARFYLEDHGLLFPMKRTSSEKPIDIAENESRQAHLQYVSRNIYQEAMQTHFRTSSMLRLWAAEFFQNSLQNNQLWMVALASAEGLNPALDENFRIYHQRMTKFENRAGASETVLAGIEFEQTTIQAQNAVRLSLEAHRDFWRALMQMYPGFNALRHSCSQISRNVAIAESKCRSLMKLDPQSPEVLFLYGAFLIHVLNDPKGADWQKQGRLMQNQAQQSSTSKVASVSSLRYVPLLHVEEASGKITKANAAACKFLCRSEDDLVGSLVDSMLPISIGNNHANLMKRFSFAGENDSIISIERSLFVLMPAGHIVLVKIVLSNVANLEAGSAGIIVASMLPDAVLNAPDTHHIMLDIPTTKIICATKNVHDLFTQLDKDHVSSMRLEGKHLRDLVPDFEGFSLSGITDPNGQVFHVRQRLPGVDIDEGRLVSVRVWARQLLTPPLWLMRFTIEKEDNQQLSQPFPVVRKLAQVVRSGSFSSLLPSWKPLMVKEGTPQLSSLPPGQGDMEVLESEDEDGFRARIAKNDSKDMSLETIRTRILHKDATIDNSVLFLSCSLSIAFVIMILMTMADYGFIHKGVHILTDNVTMLRDSVRQVETFAGVMFCVRHLSYLTSKSEVDTDLLSSTADRLLGYVDLLENTNLRLYQARPESSDEVAVRFQFGIINMDILGARQQIKSRDMSYFTALQFLMYSVRACVKDMMVSATTPESSDRIERNMYAVVQNGPDKAFFALIELSNMMRHHALVGIKTVSSFSLIYSSASVFLVMILTLFVFMPTIFYFENNNYRIHCMFLEIPMPVVHELYRKSLKALQTFNDQWGATDGCQISHEPIEVVRRSSSPRQIVKPKNNVAAADPDQPGEAGADHATPEAVSIESPEPDLPARHFQTSRVRFIKLGLRIGILLPIWAAFVSNAWIITSEMVNAGELFPEEVFSSGYISANMHMFLFNSEMAASSRGNLTESEVWYDRSMANLDEMASVHQSLMFGGNSLSSSVKLPGASKRYPKRDRLLFEDACFLFPDSDSIARCQHAPNIVEPNRTINSGNIFEIGFENAFASLILNGYAILHEIKLSPTSNARATFYTSQYVESFQQLAVGTMKDVLDQLNDLLVEEFLANQADQTWSFQRLLVLFSTSSIACILIFYVPMMKKLDRDIKRARSMFLMVPIDVLNSNDNIRSMLETI